MFGGPGSSWRAGPWLKFMQHSGVCLLLLGPLGWLGSHSLDFPCGKMPGHLFFLARPSLPERKSSDAPKKSQAPSQMSLIPVALGVCDLYRSFPHQSTTPRWGRKVEVGEVGRDPGDSGWIPCGLLALITVCVPALIIVLQKQTKHLLGNL